MAILFAVIANAVALWVAAELVPGIEIGGSGQDYLVTLVLVAVLFGVVNALVKPVVKLLSLPFIVLTVGLFLLVINALMLMLTSWLSGLLNLSFHVDAFFWSGLIGAVVISAVSLVVGMILPDTRKDR